MYYKVFLLAVLALCTSCHKQETITPAIPSNWIVQTVNQQYPGSKEVSFATAQNGWIAGNSYVSSGTSANVLALLLRTTTGGANWTSVDLSALNISGFRSLFPINDQVLYGYGAYLAASPSGQAFYVYKSQDAGQTWNKLASTGFINGRLTFLTEQIGLSGSANAIIKTTDGGVSWQKVWSGGLVGLSIIRFVTATTGYAVGGIAHDKANGGIILKTVNQGATWQNLNWTKGAMQDACFLTENIGFVLSLELDGSGNIALHKTLDGGTTWQAVNSRMPTGQYAFISEQEFYCAGKNIQHTTNAGASWQIEYTIPANNANDSFDSIQFPTSTTGYAVSHEGIIVKYTKP